MIDQENNIAITRELMGRQLILVAGSEFPMTQYDRDQFVLFHKKILREIRTRDRCDTHVLQEMVVRGFC